MPCGPNAFHSPWLFRRAGLRCPTLDRTVIPEAVDPGSIHGKKEVYHGQILAAAWKLGLPEPLACACLGHTYSGLCCVKSGDVFANPIDAAASLVFVARQIQLGL